MSVDCARGVLRLIAVTTVLIGVTMTTMAIIGWIAWGQAAIAVAGQSWSGAGMSLYPMLAHASTIAWGLALFAASSPLARRVVE